MRAIKCSKARHKSDLRRVYGYSAGREPCTNYKNVSYIFTVLQNKVNVSAHYHLITSWCKSCTTSKRLKFHQVSQFTTNKKYIIAKFLMTSFFALITTNLSIYVMRTKDTCIIFVYFCLAQTTRKVFDMPVLRNFFNNGLIIRLDRNTFCA